MSKAILFDSTLCIGCKACEVACAEKNGLAYTEQVAAQEKTSEFKLTAVMNRGDKFLRKICMHCADPACASVCPVGAFQKTKLGPVTYDESKCMGCRYCMVACPFGVPKYEWSKLSPRVRKCDMCYDRVAAGAITACAEACPTGATTFGERDQLIAEAKRRIAAGPDAYNQHIFGIEEVGGTSVLMIAAVRFDHFGLTAPAEEPLPMLTYRVLARIPDFLGVGTVLLGGVWWITRRRAVVAAVEGEGEKEK
jgi:formate dehydrogenase iron-sulfur subunit